MPRVAVIGGGYWGRNPIRKFHELDALAALADANPATARILAERHHVPARSLDAILADPGTRVS